jgi:hypothetical protein
MCLSRWELAQPLQAPQQVAEFEAGYSDLDLMISKEHVMYRYVVGDSLGLRPKSRSTAA